MKSRDRLASWRIFPQALLLLLLLVAPAGAQQPRAATAPNPQAPNLKMPTPLGIQRGTALDLTLTGTNL